MNSSFKNVLCLTLITLVAGTGLGYVYGITKEPIAQMEENTKLAAYKAVFPEAESFLPVDKADEFPTAADENACQIDSANIALDGSNNPIGYVINATTHEGYGGDISLSIGIDNSGCVKGVEILSISETAGLGMKARESRFKDQFKDKTVSLFKYTKSGASSDFEIDAISGATITTKAVTNAVNAALAYYAQAGGAGL